MHSLNWQKKFLGLAGYIAENWSKDPSTRVGAVVVGHEPNLYVGGYNGLPPGIEDTDERLNDREWKYEHVVHAEMNAILNATFEPVYLYSTHIPCVRCAVHILAKRTIRHIICPEPTGDYMSRWRASVELATARFTEAGRSVTLLKL